MNKVVVPDVCCAFVTNSEGCLLNLVVGCKQINSEVTICL